MIIEKINSIVCDMEGCSNIACVKISLDKNGKNGLKLCKNCVSKLNTLFSEYARKKG